MKTHSPTSHNAATLRYLHAMAEKDKRIAQLEAERQWKPIEQAPKDCRELLLGRAADGHWFKGRWWRERWVNENFLTVDQEAVTHYMPGPPPITSET